MKNITVLIILATLTFASQPSIAQFKLIGESSTFEEPEDGVSRIIQMKNGNTFYIHLTEKEGIDLRIYNTSHKEIVSTSMIPSFGKLKAGAFQNVFEVKNDIVLFVSEYIKNAPILYRLVIDGTTGKLKEDKALATAKGRGGMLNTAVIDAFNIKKDPVGDNYVVELYNIFEDDKDKRIEIIQYGADHVESNRAFLVTSNDDEFKFFVYMDMQVLDADKVNVILYNGKEKYFYNTKKGRMVMASIDKKLGKVTYTNIELPEIKKFAACISRYNPKTKKMYLLLRELNEKDRNNYNNFLIKIDTETNRTETKLVIDSDEKLNEKYKQQFSIKSDYVAMFKSFTVNDDESYTIIYEEEFSQSSASSRYTDFFTGKIMLMNYNPKGEVISGYIVPKLFSTNTFSNYKSFLYIDAGKNKYIAINDSERNNEVKKDKFVLIQGVSESDAFLYKMSGDALVPKRALMFEPGETGHNLASFRVSDYNAATNTLVTLKLNKKSPSNKAVSLVWIQP